MAAAVLLLTSGEAKIKIGVEAKLRDCLASVRKQHFLLGECMDTILALKLYRDEYASFDEYCDEKWSVSSSVARKAADFYRVALTMAKSQEEAPLLFWDMLQGLTPAHAAVLKNLPEEEQPKAWSEARKETVTPTVKALEAVSEKFAEKIARRANGTTAEEESEINQEIEEATIAACRREELTEIASIMAKRLRSVIRAAKHASPEFDATFKKIEALAAAIEAT